MNCTLLQELQVLQMLHILATESNCKVATLLPSEVKRTLPCGVEGAQGKCRIVLFEKWKLRERRSVSAVWRRLAYSRRAAAQPNSEQCDSD